MEWELRTGRGRVLYEQPRWHFLLQRAVGTALVAFLLGFAVLGVLMPGDPPYVGPLVAAGAVALAVGTAVSVIPPWPHRIYEDGILFPRRRNPFVRFSEVRDAQVLSHRGRSAKFLVIARTDGTWSAIGELWTKGVAFVAVEFDELARHILHGVQERGARPAVPWSEAAWKSLEPLNFRGAVITRLETLALQKGRPIIDEAFVAEVAGSDKVLLRRMRLAAAASARL